MGHTKKECLEKPAKVPARYAKEGSLPSTSQEESTVSIQPSPVRRLNFGSGDEGGGRRAKTKGYDAKRDRWDAYDPSDYREVEEEYARVEDMRAKLRDSGETVELDAPMDDEDKYAEDMAPVQGVDMDSRTRITVRNLRIREDTAKYLYNLDPHGAYYDPKSRSMRENPFKNVIEPKWGMSAEDQASYDNDQKLRDERKLADCTFLGENYVRTTGEVIDAVESQEFAQRVELEGLVVNPIADPTQLEMMRRRYETERLVKRENKQEN